jgi:hypothetical protein
MCAVRQGGVRVKKRIVVLVDGPEGLAYVVGPFLESDDRIQRAGTVARLAGFTSREVEILPLSGFGKSLLDDMMPEYHYRELREEVQHHMKGD